MNQFSGAVQITGVDDYIRPSVACQIPTEVTKKEDGVAQIAQVSLNDCLACSGCITTAEEILVNAQGPAQFVQQIQALKTRTNGEGRVVVSIAAVSRAALAARHGLPSATEAQARLHGYLAAAFGVDAVVDASIGHALHLREAAAEFVALKRENPLMKTLISGACPGWVCYAEKRLGHALPHISRVRSGQQLMGILVKRMAAQSWGVAPNDVLHVAIMPCFDKKLEATRADFVDAVSGARDVDLVLTPAELDQMLAESGTSLGAAPAIAVQPGPLQFLDASSGRLAAHAKYSGGYAEYLFRAASWDLFGVAVEAMPWKWTRRDLAVAELMGPQGNVVLRVAVANGFHNIQNVVRRLKQSNSSPFDFVELMACPSGCLNGGGQALPPAGLSAVVVSYDSHAPPSAVDNIPWDQLRSLCENRLLTSYTAVPPTDFASALSLKW